MLIFQSKNNCTNGWVVNTYCVLSGVKQNGFVLGDIILKKNAVDVKGWLVSCGAIKII